MLRRRPLLRSALSLVAATTASCAGRTAAPTDPKGEPARSPAAPPSIEDGIAGEGDTVHARLDAQLDALHAFDPEFRDGLSNHGPMACEALSMLGGSDELDAFGEHYRRRLEPMTAAEPIESEQWLASRGRPEARAGLIAMFARRLETEDPDDVLAEVVPQLAAGICGAAFHGCLRLAHGYRAWTLHPSTTRRTELAHGLGYWAARYQEMPGRLGAQPEPGLDAARLLAATPVLEASERREGLIFERFDALAGHRSFESAVARFDIETIDPELTLDEVAAASARLYLSTADPRSRFVYLHGVTGSAATRLLLPTVAPSKRRDLVAQLVHAVAGVHATHGGDGASLEAVGDAPEADVEAIVASARGSKDDHTIKLVEAALREFDRSGRPEFLAVAVDRTRA